MKPNNIVNKILLYKNIKVIVLVVYPILTLLIWINWDALCDFWFSFARVIDNVFEEPLSIIISFLYIFYSFYGFILFIHPLFILLNKNNDRIKINFDKKAIFSFSKNVIIFIFSPILLFIGGLISIGLLYVFDIAIKIWVILVSIFVILLILFLTLFSLFKILKRLY